MTKAMASALVLMLLAGCGQATVTAPKRVNPSSAPIESRLPAPGPGGGLGMTTLPETPAQAQGAQMLQQMRQTFAAAKGFDATITMYTQGHYKSGERVSELRKSTTSARLIWLKPTKLRAEVITATNPLMEGGAMVTTDGQNITARAKGLLGLIPFKLQALDGKLSNNRNHNFVENNPQAHLERLTGPNAVWTVVGQDAKGGIAVRVDGVPHLDREIDSEVVTLDARTLALKNLTMYDGQTKVVATTFNKFSWNPSVKSDTFKL